jgi:hypothetical protein
VNRYALTDSTVRRSFFAVAETLASSSDYRRVVTAAVK